MKHPEAFNVLLSDVPKLLPQILRECHALKINIIGHLLGPVRNSINSLDQAQKIPSGFRQQGLTIELELKFIP